MSTKQAGVFDYMLVFMAAVTTVTLGIATIWWVYDSWSTELYFNNWWSFLHGMTRFLSILALIPFGVFIVPPVIIRIIEAIERVLNSWEARNNVRNNLKQEQAANKPTTF